MKSGKRRRSQRAGRGPRERIRDLGSRALTEQELLAALLGSGGPGAPVSELAARILHRGGGTLRGLARLPPEALSHLPGVGWASAARVAAAMELGRRAASQQGPEGMRLSGPEDVFVRMGPLLRDLVQEEFHALLLNTQHRLLRDVLVTRGILDASLIHPREVFKAAVLESAAAVILVHNHPSGDPTPSPDDREVTRQMARAGRALGIPVLDHLVIGDGRWVSLADVLRDC